MLEKEFQYYKDNQENIVKAHYGRFVVIKDNEILGDYGTETEAVLSAKNDLGLEVGTFLVQHCMPGKENYTHFFHSRVIFNQ